MATRELILKASAIMVKERKGALIMLRSMQAEDKVEWMGETAMPVEDPALVRAQMKKGFMYVEHIDNDSCWFHGYISIDPMFSYLPHWLLNFTIKRVLYIIIGKLQSKEIFENDLIKARMAEKEDYY